MRIDIKNIKNQKKNLIVLAICFVIITASGIATYKFLQTGDNEISNKSWANSSSSSQSGAQVTEQPVATNTSDTVAHAQETIVVTKDPFKAEFLEKFLKEEKLPASAVLKSPPIELPKLVLPDKQPVAEPQEVKKEFPKINILGIYRINEKNIALTDKGELREGMFVEKYKRLLFINP